MHLESTESKSLMNVKVDLLKEIEKAKEVEEEEIVSANLQESKVSFIIMLKGTNFLTFLISQCHASPSY